MKKLNFLMLLLICFNAFSQEKIKTKYYRHLMYNHVSPHVPLKGIFKINSKEAKNTSHYIFKYNKSNQLIEIVNNHYHLELQHPLGTIGVYKTVISYTDTSETRTFFDIKGEPTTNNKSVFQEIYLINEDGFKYDLTFKNLEGEPMESNWKVAHYQWEKKADLVIERRYNLKNEAVNISPYFRFGITGISYNKKGQPVANYNLNEQLEVAEDTFGVASYRDVYNNKGSHIQYSYHDKEGNLTLNQWGFAIGKNVYNELGNSIERNTYDENKKLIKIRKLPSDLDIKIADSASKQDSVEIKEISLGYLVALQQLKPDLMERVMHENLAKRTVSFNPREEKEILRETTYEQMIKFAKSWNKSGTRFPPNPKNEAFILDIYDMSASVKLVSDNWVEYLHLSKINNEWKIVNLLWQYRNINRYLSK